MIDPTPEQIERERLLSVFEEYYSVPGPDQDELYDREGLIDGLVAMAAAGAAPQETGEPHECECGCPTDMDHLQRAFDDLADEYTKYRNSMRERLQALNEMNADLAAPGQVDESKLAELVERAERLTQLSAAAGSPIAEFGVSKDIAFVRGVRWTLERLRGGGQ